ncbi:ROK family protein [Collinsella sp. BA40]|nr:ROK family protein [Collinsella sp. BA40]
MGRILQRRYGRLPAVARGRSCKGEMVRMACVFGVDVGGTTIKFSVIDEAGTICEHWAIPTNTADAGASIPADIAAQLVAKNAELAQTGEAALAIGVGVPGPVCEGMVERAVNLG